MGNKMKCSICKGTGKIDTQKIKVYVVWDIFIPDRDVAIRAICTDEERANKYVSMIKKQHEGFNNKDKFDTHVECIEINHCVGFLSLKRIGEQSNMEK